MVDKKQLEKRVSNIEQRKLSETQRRHSFDKDVLALEAT